MIFVHYQFETKEGGEGFGTLESDKQLKETLTRLCNIAISKEYKNIVINNIII